MPTDLTEKGLETTIVTSLVEDSGYLQGDPKDFNRDFAVDWKHLLAFLQATQPQVVAQLGIEEEGTKRREFLYRLQGEITKRGTVEVLRKGIQHGPVSLTLFYGTPSVGNPLAQERFAANLFSVTRQLRYSKNEANRALDMAVFVNGLPLITFELKNKFTKQTVQDAVEQYKKDRDEKELLFLFGRCLVHFAVDDHEVRMCTQLKGKNSWFLPFNQGCNDGAGNPPNPEGLATDYLWKRILTKPSLTNIVENYAQVTSEKDGRGQGKRSQVFPRYHQLDVVRKLLADCDSRGVGGRYLIQHSAGSGKSNSIAWLAHQLIELQRDGKSMFDSIIVVTDRLVLDKQLRDTIRRFTDVASTVGHADKAGDLRSFLSNEKKIIISTIQKFPYILDTLGNEHRGRKYAIIIDEAHSSQGGRTAAKMHVALTEDAFIDKEEKTPDEKIAEIIKSRRILNNASYFAFTATPKGKTLEIFGEPYQEGEVTKHRPFHSYTMKQAIQEGFILDVLEHYTPVYSYYRLAKAVEDDPVFDTKKARKKLRKYVEDHEEAIRWKTETMVDHFHDSVQRMIGNQARAMVITGSIKRAISYFHTFNEYLKQRRSPYKAIVAFSGEHEYGGVKVTEASLNGFPSNKIPDNVRQDPYRFLIAADKFQTGYDEPLLHTMYVDKVLSGIKAVQTLSRLNRAHPDKHDPFILDFVNDTDTIEFAFTDYYRTTILSRETDPNKLHDLKSALDGAQVYAWPQVERLVELFLSGAKRELLDAILDTCVRTYLDELDEDGQVDFKGKAKAFTRTYSFLSAILPYEMPDWERLSIFLNLLIPKLPAPREEDLSQGILEAIDMDSYRLEMQAARSLTLPDADAEIDPIPTEGGGHKPEPELDVLSNIIREFNDLFGNIEWNDADKIRRVITEEIPDKVRADIAYQNAIRNSDKQNARVEHDEALSRVITALLTDHTELFKQFSDNPGFKKWLSDMNFGLTYGNQKSTRETL
jgi:type I restriction enzyme R subunit